MNSRLKPLLITVFILFIINLVIFLAREKGFAYIKYAAKEELYPDKIDKKFLQIWSEENKKFSGKEIVEGLAILKTELGIDTVSEVQDKPIRIAKWIYNTFSQQRGKPADTLKKITPLNQYLYLTSHKDEKLWCGQFQSMFGFFSTCAGLLNRYIEIVPMNKNAGDYHEVNEVYLPDQNRWIMVDVTRNRLMIKKDQQVFSAADYLDHKIRHADSPVLITYSSDLLISADSIQDLNDLEDNYFNSNYALRYYKTMELPKAYNPISKIKRYIFSHSWYEMYDPVRHHSNYLFRVKQFFFFALICSALLFMWKIVTHLRSRSKKKS